MFRVFCVLLVLAALLGGATWLLAPSLRSRDADQAEEGVAREAARPSALAPPVVVGDPADDEPSESASRRVSAAAPRGVEREQPHEVTGRVVFPPGTPLDEEAWVVAKAGVDGEHSRARVAADGTFRVSFAPKSYSGRLELVARYLVLRNEPLWRRSKGDGPFVLEPVLGGRIAGRLRLPEGTLRVEGTVSLLTPRYILVRRNSLAPDEDPSFAFDGLEPSEYRLEFHGADLRGRGRCTITPGTTTTVELVLGRSARVAGVVRDEHGAALPDVSITVNVLADGFEVGDRTFHEPPPRDGAFAFEGLWSGDAELDASRDGYVYRVLSLGFLAAGDYREDVVLVLERGLTIAGSVRWWDGTPAEATIEADRVEGSADLDADSAIAFDWWKSVSTSSGLDGRFELSGLEPGEYEVRAHATRDGESHRVKSDAVIAGARDVDLVLSQGLVLTGTVVDERGVPLSEFTVRAERDESGESIDVFGRPGDADGMFELAGLEPGEWTVEVSSRGHADPEPQRVTMPSEPVQLVVPREAVVRGVVLDAQGSPVERVRVVASRERGDLDKDLCSDRTDRDGEFRIGRLPEGTITLVVGGSEGAPRASVEVECIAGNETRGVVLRLPPRDVVSGPR